MAKKQMDAVQYTRLYRRLELVKIPVPKVKDPNDVLIKVLFSGICKTDIEIIDGEVPCNIYEPFIMGHEICGAVVDIGADVLLIKKEDKVVVEPYIGCGNCICCRRGTSHLCRGGCLENTLGTWLNGGWSEYILIPQIRVHKLPQNVRLEQATMAEPLSYTIHAWNQLAPIPVGTKILVNGAGLTGLLWIVMLHYHGHQNVRVCEPNLCRHEYIQQLGIRYELVSPQVMTSRQEYEPEYFDLIIDCSGSEKAIQLAFKLLNVGGRLCLAGKAKKDVSVSFSPSELKEGQKTIIGVDKGSFVFPGSIDALEYLGDRYLSFFGLGIKTYPLEKYKQAVEHVRKGSVLKAIFRLPDECKCNKQ